MEAAQCGCPIILSNNVGAKMELLNGNGFIFNLNDEYDLFKKMKKFIFTKEKKIEEMSNKSIALSKKISQKKIYNLIKNL